MAQTLVTKTCLKCKAEFQVPAHRRDTAKYCSEACRMTRNAPKEHICDYCKQPYIMRYGLSKVKRNKRNFCSRECTNRWKSENAELINFQRGVFKPRPSRVKRVTLKCSQCQKTFEDRPFRQGRYENVFCSRECFHQWHSVFMSGDNGPGWKGGRVGYYGPNWRRQARAARRRDNYTCQHCGTTEETLGFKLDVHHIQPFRTFGYLAGVNDAYKEANRSSNLVSLCPSCHKRAEPTDVVSHPNIALSATEIRKQIAANRTEKSCTKCKQIKPLNEFHRNAKCPDGRTTLCKKCACEHAKKYRTPKQEFPGRTKINPAIVTEIRTRAANGEQLSALAREFELTPDHVSSIIHRKAWKKIP